MLGTVQPETSSSSDVLQLSSTGQICRSSGSTLRVMKKLLIHSLVRLLQMQLISIVLWTPEVTPLLIRPHQRLCRHKHFDLPHRQHRAKLTQPRHSKTVAPVVMAVFPTTPPITELEGLRRMVVAVCSGLTIGYLRRERRGMMKTMAMVSLGAATFTLNALIGMPHSDPGRTTAAIISGVGFLGAGVITQPVTVMEGRRANTTKSKQESDGSDRTQLTIRPVYGLTTAAAIWMSAAMGIACGAGRLTLCIGGTLLTVAVLKFKLPWKSSANPFISFSSKRSL